MQNPRSRTASRRDLLKTSGYAAAAATLSGALVPAVHAAGSDLV
ncbi:MAG: twin-arginine translocation signal domain-containing protein, partial [Phycisphaerae bacterium]